MLVKSIPCRLTQPRQTSVSLLSETRREGSSNAGPEAGQVRECAPKGQKWKPPLTLPHEKYRISPLPAALHCIEVK